MSTNAPTKHPKADKNGWIKFSDEIPPTGKLFYVTQVNTPKLILVSGDINEGMTHWQPCGLPLPPVPEKTQREIDEEARKEWQRENFGPWVMYSDMWHAALAWERTRTPRT